MYAATEEITFLLAARRLSVDHILNIPNIPNIDCNIIISVSFPILVYVQPKLLERKVAAPVWKTEINDRRGSAALTKRNPSIHKSWH
jgi:hypothetical protein